MVELGDGLVWTVSATKLYYFFSSKGLLGKFEIFVERSLPIDVIKCQGDNEC